MPLIINGELPDSALDDLNERYRDADLGATLTNTKKISNSLVPLTNTTAINISVNGDKSGKVKVITLTRGTMFNKQRLTFKTLTDHTDYIAGLMELEKTVMVFFKQFIAGEKTMSDIGFERFNQGLNMYNLDTLPETMHYIHEQFTADVILWARFKKLFATISLIIDPMIIDTVKWKFFQYLLDQRRVVVISDHATNGMIKEAKPTAEIHKVMDLFIFMPYVYLFFIYKHLNASGEMDQLLTTNASLNTVL